MTKSFRTLDDVNVKGKRVCCAGTSMFPESGCVRHASGRVAPTITKSPARRQGDPARVFRRPGAAMPDAGPVAEALSKVIKKPVGFAKIASAARRESHPAMKDGDILCLENTSTRKKRRTTRLRRRAGKTGDIWVNAPSPPRTRHASTEASATSCRPMRDGPCRPSSTRSARRWTRRPACDRHQQAQKFRPRSSSRKEIQQGRRACDRRRHGQHPCMRRALGSASWRKICADGAAYLERPKPQARSSSRPTPSPITSWSTRPRTRMAGCDSC